MQILINRRRTNAKRVHQTHLIVIEADVAVRQKNTNTILLDRVRISLCQSVVVAHAANTKNISHLTVIFFYNNLCRLHHAIAVNLLVGKIGPGSKWAVVASQDCMHNRQRPCKKQDLCRWSKSAHTATRTETSSGCSFAIHSRCDAKQRPAQKQCKCRQAKSTSPP